MAVLFVIAFILWVGIMLMVLALCVSAARGDAQVASQLDVARERAGRFGRGKHIRLVPRTPAH